MAYQSKSYRKFIATAATATLVASAVTPAFAAGFTDVSDRYKEAVDYLVEQEITNGISETKYGTAQTITRVDAAVLIAKALDLNVENAKDAGFTDVPGRAVSYVNALKQEGIINGKTATTFGSSQNITRGEMALIIARAYDLEGNKANLAFTDVSDRYDEAVAALVDNKVTFGKTETKFGTNDSVTRGEFALFLYRLATPEEVQAPAVAKVESVNAKQVVITFNTALNKEAAAQKTLYTVNGANPTAVKLSDDQKSITLTYADSIEATDGVVVVNPITTEQKDENGAALKTAKYTSVFTYKDTVKPVVTDTSYTNGVITLTFSEEIGTKPTVVRVNGTPVTGDSVSIDSSNKTEVNIASDLSAGSSASLYIAGATDTADAANEMELYNGFVSAPTADTNKPHVTDVQVTGQNKAKITLSESVTEAEINATVQRSADQTAVKLVKDVADTSGKTYTLTVDLNGAAAGDGIFAGSSVSETFTLYIQKDAMTDRSGLKNDLYSTPLTFKKDTQAPSLVSSKVTAGNKKLAFTFDEAVTVSGSINAIDVRDEDGVKFTAIAAETSLTEDKKTFEVDIKSGDTAMDAGTYAVTLPANFFSDAYGNKTGAVTDKFTVGTSTNEDTEKPTATVKTTGKNEFTVTYNEEVTSSAIKLSNYRLDGQALPSKTDIYFKDSSKKEVVITLPEGSVNIGDQTTGAPAVLGVSGVADKAGNVSTAEHFVVTVKDNTPATVTGVEVYGTTVVVEFSDAIELPAAPTDANDVLDVTVNGTAAEAQNMTAVAGNVKALQFTLTSAPAAKPVVKVKEGQEALKDANGVIVK
ncbi:hypothetical protein AWH48_07775 [Domibacillus aminovorans]|uniref:SLH domain-containing protein n=1 Tax=Domibacillus aminovorans TaxID=29332 RepID=A0A177KM34_9BACI|nr:S-layer homology domain-containing protein [Domibacillus aminovorans]OAH54488.1 hypothetical protein AWH48_07775 [Domibacillus aminovorans]